MPADDLLQRIRIAQRDAGEKAVCDWLKEKGLLDRVEKVADEWAEKRFSGVYCISCGKYKDRCEGC